MANQLENNIVHLPDLSFVHFCEKEFGINRGIYNQIDTWFYNKGKIDIVDRRRKVLKFFKQSFTNGHIKIGKHGLSMRLEQFWEDYESQSHAR